ncbi:MAG TPA: TIGR00730 family Rossman fold protein [Candidatus Thioglobus sp.]|nr:TIGR00730 family Rossman fold protein [Candidatus Thioglobus sp.]
MKIDIVEKELANAAELLEKFSNNISIFGSARITQDDTLADQAYQLGKALSNKGFNVLTGAGPGIMQAVNRGAFEGKSSSIGLNIKLPKEQKPNPYLDECLMFEHFFTRKVILIKYADACVFFPGGFGTADELLEVLTLLQTRKNRRIKIYLFDRAFWLPMITWFEALEKKGYISKEDLEHFCIVDKIEQILTGIEA